LGVSDDSYHVTKCIKEKGAANCASSTAKKYDVSGPNSVLRASPNSQAKFVLSTAAHGVVDYAKWVGEFGLGLVEAVIDQPRLQFYYEHQESMCIGASPALCQKRMTALIQKRQAAYAQGIHEFCGDPLPSSQMYCRLARVMSAADKGMNQFLTKMYVHGVYPASLMSVNPITRVRALFYGGKATLAEGEKLLDHVLRGPAKKALRGVCGMLGSAKGTCIKLVTKGFKGLLTIMKLPFKIAGKVLTLAGRVGKQLLKAGKDVASNMRKFAVKLGKRVYHFAMKAGKLVLMVGNKAFKIGTKLAHDLAHKALNFAHGVAKLGKKALKKVSYAAKVAVKFASHIAKKVLKGAGKLAKSVKKKVTHVASKVFKTTKKVAGGAIKEGKKVFRGAKKVGKSVLHGIASIFKKRAMESSKKRLLAAKY